jgi:hypothetical protein
VSRKIRIVIGVIILTVSIVLLVWSFKPLGREIRTQPISPSELQLPTPTSLLIQPELVS